MPTDKHSLYELDILKHVENDCRLNNRMASKKLGVSVKLAHEVLKKMVDRGLLHVKKIHSRRWDYFLTSEGIKEKARLTMEFLDFSLHFYREARKRSALVCRNLHENGIKTVDFLGAGEPAEITMLGMKEWNLQLINVYDDKAETFLGSPVLSIDELKNHNAEAIIICLYDPAHPMTPGFLPEGITRLDNMHWIFE